MAIQACKAGGWRVYRVSKLDTGKRFTPVADGLPDIGSAKVAALEDAASHGPGKFRIVEMGNPKQHRFKVKIKRAR